MKFEITDFRILREISEDVITDVVVQLCLALNDPMDYSTPGFLVLHYLLEFAVTQVH